MVFSIINNLGVMNTDNFSILGLTLDYGPFQFLDQYDPAYVCNTSDYTGRYSFEKQPDIGFWNCMRLAIALSPLIKEETTPEIQKHLVNALKKYQEYYDCYYKEEMLEKLGIYKHMDSDMDDIVYPLLKVMKDLKLDYTLFFRYICSFSDEEFGESFKDKIANSSLTEWIAKFKKRLEKEDISAKVRTQRTLSKNPLIIPRNHLLLNVIKEANLGNNEPLIEYWTALQEPYSSKWVNSAWAQEPSPQQSGLKCSCSS
jgi:uncharacterized protein YdiU (UPF0061 family)